MSAQRRARAVRLAAASLFAAALGAVGLACPSRNLDIAIDANGLLTVVEACEAIEHVCDGKVRATCDPIFCQWEPPTPTAPGFCHINNPCTLAPGGMHAYAVGSATSLQLVLLNAGALQVQALGPCVCFDDRDFLCQDGGSGGLQSAADCWAASIDTKLAAQMPAGLTFSGFNDPDQGILAMAWFQPISDAGCDALPEAGTALCSDPRNIVACAGLGAPAGASTYDITCASCRDGVHGSIGNDNGPCPSTPAAANDAGTCFLQSCAAAMFPGKTSP